MLKREWQKALACMTFSVVLGNSGLLAQDQERPRRNDEPGATARQASEPEQGKEAAKLVPGETKAVSQHVWTAGGHNVHYTATAGNLLIRDDDEKANGSLFYTS